MQGGRAPHREENGYDRETGKWERDKPKAEMGRVDSDIDAQQKAEPGGGQQTPNADRTVTYM